MGRAEAFQSGLAIGCRMVAIPRRPVLVDVVSLAAALVNVTSLAVTGVTERGDVLGFVAEEAPTPFVGTP